MIIGTYRRFCLADIGILGWRGVIPNRRYYVALLWGWFANGTPKVKVQTIALSPVYTKDGRQFGTGSQFQKIFRLLNGDELFYAPLDFQRTVDNIRQSIHDIPVNFFINFLIKGKSHSVREITLCEKAEYLPSSFAWPSNWVPHFLGLRETPSNRTVKRNLAVQAKPRLKVVRQSVEDMNISITDELQRLDNESPIA